MFPKQNQTAPINNQINHIHNTIHSPNNPHQISKVLIKRPCILRHFHMHRPHIIFKPYGRHHSHRIWLTIHTELVKVIHLSLQGYQSTFTDLQIIFIIHPLSIHFLHLVQWSYLSILYLSLYLLHSLICMVMRSKWQMINSMR